MKKKKVAGDTIELDDSTLRGRLIMTAEWVKLESRNAAPPEDCRGQLLWVIESFYECGVTVGRYNDYHWEYTNGEDGWYDDCLVTHYAKMNLPEEPEE